MRTIGLAAAVALGFACPGEVGAQGARSSVNLPQSDGSEEAAGQTAPVGAGSSDAVTTGVSGPASSDSGGEITVPPVPREDLCQDYLNQPAYEPCLETVTAQGSEQ
jgi:hypothetical protein